ncbi:hypothetical protein ANCDUO_14531 [Ancylostoma duodenale]|uniref:C-type lectin domain-containing protein n=1 Tax=Ancylostoma duodenale TaxID=51022 RepID=A0A0C2CG25_9BILA|nr:hypothetical protein ANCDUO_14531 [Ancylostoma duodenale]
MWIGARKLNGTWKWVTGRVLRFQKWSAGEPNNMWGEEECAQMYTRDVIAPTDGEGDSYWNDVRCDRVMRFFVCKKIRKR